MKQRPRTPKLILPQEAQTRTSQAGEPVFDLVRMSRFKAEPGSTRYSFQLRDGLIVKVWLHGGLALVRHTYMGAKLWLGPGQGTQRIIDIRITVQSDGDFKQNVA